MMQLLAAMLLLLATVMAVLDAHAFLQMQRAVFADSWDARGPQGRARRINLRVTLNRGKWPKGG